MKKSKELPQTPVETREECLSVSKELPPRPYCNVYAKAIPLEDALEDSPMFRKRLREAESEAEDFASGIKRVIKVSKQYQAASNAYVESFKDFIREISNFKGTMGCNDEVLDSGFAHFTTGLKEIASFQEFLGTQMEGLVSAPLNEFVNTDVKQVKESFKKYEKSIKDLDSAVSKLGQVKKKNSESKVEQLSVDVEDAKKAHRASCLEVTLRLNEVLAKKKFEFLERVCVYIQSQSTFFHQGYQFFTDNEPKIKNYSLYLQSTRKNFIEETEQYERHKSLLLDELPSSPEAKRRTADPTSAASMRGYIFKRSDDVININTWNRRYFVLKDGVLCYYKTGNEENPDMTLPLLLCTVKLRPDFERRNCFEIVSPPDRSLILQAESEELMHQWVQALQASISNSLNAQSPAGEKKKVQVEKDESELPLAKLRALSPGNCVCADCNSKDPDWASFNLGVLLCIDCSGVHRSLGVHISKVRSLSLDQWEPDLMDMMCGLGNEFVNSVYEANLEGRVKPVGTDTSNDRPPLSSTSSETKISVTSPPRSIFNSNRKSRRALYGTSEAKNRYIRDKYEKKLFCKKYVPVTENADEATIKLEMSKKLFAAIEQNDIRQTFELIVQGANLAYQSPEHEQRTPVHEAILAENAAILVLLLMHNAVPDLKDARGWTPLHEASDKGLANCAVLLLQKNTVNSLSEKDNEGRTPLELAMARGSAHVVTLLRLAQLARDEAQEGAQAFEESFADALRQFARDARETNKS
eukprot:Phypoly_transcript_03500.p1 GENE.Phypoly_transcript_03500~~Phypoly_transcript_03500.p1  ORF type:complete len:754 (+),score=141.83 Phypoly_transcript_03500:176-2437(+)